MRLVAGGDRVHYPYNAGMPTADLLTIKLLIKSIILTPGTRFFTMDIKNFYLCMPMSRYEYMQLKLLDMPEDVIAHYKLLNIATLDRYVYCEICQGMYGLPQAGIIAQELLAKRLKEHGYSQSETTPGLWKHKWCPVWFSLVVDNFGVKYNSKEHVQHLLQMAKILKVLVQTRRGKILRTHHQMGLSGQEGAHIDAFLPQKRTQTIPTSPPDRAAGPTAPTRQKTIWGKSPTCKVTQ
jgi:hypothetical protein